MHRFYADASGIVDGMATLPPEDAVHAARVLRMKPGEACEFFCAGKRYRAEVAELSPQRVTLRMLEELPTTEPRLRITLYQGLPKAEKRRIRRASC